MDTSFLAPGPITWASLIGCMLAVVAIVKGIDWLQARSKAGTTAAVSPLTIDMAAVKIEVSSVKDQLNAFKIEVARTYVTGDVITRLERRIDEMMLSVRDEMRETREQMLKALMNRRLGD
ncbi:hypothetical protein ASG40_13060 [Methylobacterium sp. Leaf399]|uniref:hypothetical protein n=1 Tax=unclassified Methylobacterium TaxID=2615210 RepID=UPI0006F2906C|nr:MULTISPECIES: hypothetical protein [unclassified Methylobacterium]KQP50850.1 hypothetical protein ASF39_11440 [Methylobacterium sp. Leaf108]KQT07831.1 hypothetical protein ASG40_13060 [Methylobacterium sp. Leaf399]